VFITLNPYLTWSRLRNSSFMWHPIRILSIKSFLP
jgi:hypothetical protein